jgi:hypothetical protein
MISGILALLLAAAPPTMVALDNPVMVQLHGAESGSASLFGTSGTVVVEIELNSQKTNDAKVAIVEGDCAHPGRGAYALSDTVSGQSTTRIPNVSLQQVVGKHRAVIVRRGAKPDAPPLACGEIKGS